MASKPIKMPDLPNMHHGSKEVFKIDHASANTTNNSKSHDRKMNHDLERSQMDNACANSANNLESHGRKMNHDLEKSQMGDACANSTNNSESHDTKINYSLEEAEKMDHASANSGNNSEIHGKMANQTTIDASTTDSASSASGQKDEASQINAKMKTSKPTSKPPNIANHTRNISDPTAGTTKGFPVNTKNTNQGKRSGSSSRSDSLESISSVHIKPHTGGDVRWDAINMVSRGNGLNLSHFRLLKRVGYGDIGSVYLVELKESKAFFAMKVMDKASLASRNKLLRAQTEREILGILDHPFLPTLYSYFETEKYYCLIMEFCSCGSLHSLRLKQPNKHFTEEATRFYCSEILLALEYLHMLGIVYRDLKPENVLVRDEGHIMLSDFDLSLRCSVNPTLVKSSSAHVSSNGSSGGILDNEQTVLQACKQPSSFFPRILPSKKNRKSKSDFGLMVGGRLPELMAEPTNVRSMSFVGTHEYLAPEIIRGEGHGSAVDWWTFGIFLYELLHGTTPFKGAGNKATLYNVVGQPLKFPDKPRVSNVARDLIKGLLVKEPQKRFAYNRGATEIKQHPFFEGVNWALVRSATPPIIPERLDFSKFSNKENVAKVDKKIADIVASDHSSHTQPDSSCEDFEYF